MLDKVLMDQHILSILVSGIGIYIEQSTMLLKLMLVKKPMNPPHDGDLYAGILFNDFFRFHLHP